MPDPVSATVASLGLGVLGSYLANRVEDAQKPLVQILLTRLAESNSGLPQNHTVLLACQKALRHALELMVQSMDVTIAEPKNLVEAIRNVYDEDGNWQPLLSRWKTAEGDWIRTFLKQSKSDALSQVNLSVFHDDDALSRAISSSIDSSLQQGFHEAILDWATTHVLDGREPQFFREWVLEGWPIASDLPNSKITLYSTWCLFYREEIKHDQGLFNALASDWLSKGNSQLCQIGIVQDELTEWLNVQLGDQRKLLDDLIGAVNSLSDEVSNCKNSLGQIIAIVGEFRNDEAFRSEQFFELIKGQREATERLERRIRDDHRTFRELLEELRDRISVSGSDENAEKLDKGRLGELINVPRIPPHYQEYPTRIQRATELLLEASSSPVGFSSASSSFGLQGMGGIGKSVLAAAVANTITVRERFRDGVLWVRLGPDVSESAIVVRLTQIAQAIDGQEHFFEDSQQAGSYLSRKLRNKSYLLVLDDVWDISHASCFEFLSGDSRLLITTRDSEVLRAIGAREHKLELLNLDDSLKLLAKAAGQPAQELPSVAADIAKECGYLPLALAMAGGTVRRPPESWQLLFQRLQKADMPQLRKRFLNYPYPDILKALSVSFDYLDANVRDLYVSLAVFPENTSFPETAALALWTSRGIDQLDAQEAIDRLVDVSLLQVDNKGRYYLHDLLGKFVKTQALNVVALHEDLVSGYLVGCNHDWSKAVSDGYLFEHFLEHLAACRSRHEVSTHLTSYGWLSRKLRETSVVETLNDLTLYGEGAKATLVGDVVRLSAHVLSEDPGALASQLIGRIRNPQSTDLELLLNEASQGCKLLVPSWPSLEPPGTSMVATFSMHSEFVVDVQTAASICVTLDGGGTVCLWDVDTTNLKLRIDSQLHLATAIGLSHDGSILAIGRSDGSVSLWDTVGGGLIEEHQNQFSAVTTIVFTGHREYSSADDMGNVFVQPVGRTTARHHLKHDDSVYAMLFLTERSILVTASDDTTVRAWDVATGNQVAEYIEYRHQPPEPSGGAAASSGSTTDKSRYEDFAYPASHILTTSNENLLVTVSRNRRVTIWELATATQVQVIQEERSEITSIACDSKGETIAIGLADGSMTLWNILIRARTFVPSLFDGPVTAVAISPDGSTVIAASYAGNLSIVGNGSGRLSRKLKAHQATVSTLKFTDKHLLLSGSDDCAIKVWNVLSRTPESAQASQRYDIAPTAIAIGEKYGPVFVGLPDGSIDVFDRFAGTCLRTLKRHTDVITKIVLTHDRSKVLSSSFDGVICVWNLATGELLYESTDHDNVVTDISLSNCNTMFASSSDDKSVIVRELGSGKQIAKFDSFKRGTTSVAFSHNGSEVISGTSDGGLFVLDIAKAECRKTISAHRETITSLTSYPQGIVSASRDGEIRFWNLTDLRLTKEFKADLSGVRSIALLGDSGPLLWTSFGGSMSLWDCNREVMIQRLTSEEVRVSLVASTNCGTAAIVATQNRRLRFVQLRGDISVGRYRENPASTVAVASDDSFAICGRKDGTLTTFCPVRGIETKTHRFPTDLACISLDVVLLATGTTIKVGNPRASKALRILEHKKTVSCMASTPDGVIAVSGALDASVRVWNLKDGTVLRRYEGHSDAVVAVAISPCGTIVASAGLDGYIKVWKTKDGSEVLSEKLDDIPFAVTVSLVHQCLICCTHSGTMLRFKLDGTVPCESIASHKDAISAASLMLDEAILITASRDKTIKAWSTKDMRLLDVFHGEWPFTCLSTGNRHIVAADEGGIIHGLRVQAEPQSPR